MKTMKTLYLSDEKILKLCKGPLTSTRDLVSDKFFGPLLKPGSKRPISQKSYVIGGTWGYIELPFLVIHPFFYKYTVLSSIIDVSCQDLESIARYAKYVVTETTEGFTKNQIITEEEYFTNVHVNAVTGGEGFKQLTSSINLVQLYKTVSEQVKLNPGNKYLAKKLNAIELFIRHDLLSCIGNRLMFVVPPVFRPVVLTDEEVIYHGHTVGYHLVLTYLDMLKEYTGQRAIILKRNIQFIFEEVSKNR